MECRRHDAFQHRRADRTGSISADQIIWQAWQNRRKESIMAQNWLLFGSGVVMLGLGLVHTIVGEKYLVRRVLKRDLPKLFGDESFTKLTIRYVWHLVTIQCAASAAILFYLAREPSRHYMPIVAILAISFVVCGVWGAIGTRGRHLSWIALIIAGLLAGFGAA
jgi:hypothetical protein